MRLKHGLRNPLGLLRQVAFYATKYIAICFILAVFVHVCSKISFEWIYLAYIPKDVLKKIIKPVIWYLRTETKKQRVWRFKELPFSSKVLVGVHGEFDFQKVYGFWS